MRKIVTHFLAGAAIALAWAGPVHAGLYDNGAAVKFAAPEPAAAGMRLAQAGAANPAAVGQAMLVPLKAWVPQFSVSTEKSVLAETTLTPGAVTSGLMRPSCVGP